MTSGFAHDLNGTELQALRQGRSDALARVYDRFAGPVYGLALRVLGNPDDAADLVQELFMKLPAAARQFRGQAPFGFWLRQLAANATVDSLRQRRRLVPLDEARQELAGQPELADAIDAAGLLARLSPSARLVLLMHAVEGYTHAEMAALFGQSESYSKSVLARALRRLRGALAEEDRTETLNERPLAQR